MGRGSRFLGRTGEQWRAGRPGAHPGTGESVSDWLPRFQQARRALIRKAVSVVLILATLVAGDVVVTWRREAQDHSRVESERSTEIQRIEDFVSSARHLRFTRPVSVKFLSTDDFDHTPAADPAILRNYLVDLYPAMRAVHLSTGPSDPTAMAQAASKTEYGSYDHDSIVVRGTELTPFVRRVLAHELTHAIDDQNFDLEQVRRRVSPTVNALSVDALIEGDARRVENAFVASLPADQRALAVPPDQSLTLARTDLPDDIRTLIAFPYDQGVQFVTALADAGGETTVDNAFADPPPFTHDIFHPDVYLDPGRRREVDDAIANIPNPTPVGPVLVGPDKTETFGELFTRLLLTPTLGADQAATAAGAWNGDRSIRWSTESQYCVRIHYAPTAQTDSILTSALAAWTAAHPGTQLNGDDLTSCG
jgi:hypothetical protein